MDEVNCFSLKVGTLKNNDHCGSISIDNFDINLFMYLDSLNFNTCLNKKITISETGDIKNCPSMSSTFGNISLTKFSDLILYSEFTKLWKVTKNLIDVCKNCEFRYICTDCRFYITDPTDIYSKPLKCGYDPSTGTWDKWCDDKNKLSLFKNYYLKNL